MNVFKAGNVVESLSGRDRGRWFLVKEVLDDSYVLLVDGSLRPMEKPKKKKTKHLIPKQECISSLRDKMERGEPVTNHELFRMISSLRDQGLDAPCKEGKQCLSRM